MPDRFQCSWCRGWCWERNSVGTFCSQRCKQAFARWQDEEYARLTG